MTISFTTLMLVILAAFVIGIIFGASLARQGERRSEPEKTYKVVKEISDEEYERLTNPKLDLEIKEGPDIPELDILKGRKLDRQFLIEKKKPDILTDSKFEERFLKERECPRAEVK